MPSTDELEAQSLGQIDADLAQLAAHVDRWIQDRFLESATSTGLTHEDIAGLVTWLRQWHTQFDSYQEAAATLDAAGRPAVKERLVAVHTQIDASISSFVAMAAELT